MRGRYSVCMLSMALVLLSLPVATAESSSPPPLSPTIKTLYAHYNPDTTAFFMNTLEVDGDDSNVGVGAGPNSALLDYTWTLPLSPRLDRDIGLDVDDTIVITAYIGGGTGAGSISVSTQLLLGTTVVADGEAQDLNQVPAGTTVSGVGVLNKYQAVTWSVKPTIDLLKAGGELTWTIHATGSSSGTFLGASDARGRSNMVLPITEVSATAVENVVYETLTGATATVAKTFSEPATQVLVYNWTTELSSPVIDFEATVENGTIEARILDGANKTAYSKTLEATGTDQAEPEGTAGTWTIEITLTDFVGEFELTVAANSGGGDKPVASPGDKPAAGNSGATSKSVPQADTDKASGNQADAEVSKGTPGFAPALGVLALLAIGLLRRKA